MVRFGNPANDPPHPQPESKSVTWFLAPGGVRVWWKPWPSKPHEPWAAKSAAKSCVGFSAVFWAAHAARDMIIALASPRVATSFQNGLERIQTLMAEGSR